MELTLMKGGRSHKKTCSKNGKEQIACKKLWYRKLCSSSSIVLSKCLKIIEMTWKLCKSRLCLNSCVWLSVQVSQNMYLAEMFDDGAMKSWMKIGSTAVCCIDLLDRQVRGDPWSKKSRIAILWRSKCWILVCSARQEARIKFLSSSTGTWFMKT